MSEFTGLRGFSRRSVGTNNWAALLRLPCALLLRYDFGALTDNQHAVRGNAILDVAVLEPIALMAARGNAIRAHVHDRLAFEGDGLSRVFVCPEVCHISATNLTLLAVFCDLHDVGFCSEF